MFRRPTMLSFTEPKKTVDNDVEITMNNDCFKSSNNDNDNDNEIILLRHKHIKIML